MKVIVDADACPVKDIIIEETRKKGVPVVLVSSINHHSHKTLANNVTVVYVDAGPDAADFKIIQLAEAGDVVVTQDYGLASLLLPKKVTVMHHSGFRYTDHNIDDLLAKRHMGGMIRRSGGRTKGPKPFKDADKKRFLEGFNRATILDLEE